MSQDFGLFLNIVFVALLYFFIAYVTKKSFSPFVAKVKPENEPFARVDVNNRKPRSTASLLDSLGAIYKLTNMNTIGRAESCDVVLENEFTSHHHATIFYENGWYIKDEGSTNGTFVNGRKVNNQARLAYGDKVTVGQSTFSFER